MAVGRFQVMAVLQAARAYKLGLDEEEAKSFGLNRAIFYAAAKYGFGKKRYTSHTYGKSNKSKSKSKKIKPNKYSIYQLGDETAYMVMRNGRKQFTMGNQVQTLEKFNSQIRSRFGNKFEKAWQEALLIVSKYDKGVLLSQRYFYETIYKPRRDDLAKKWTEMAKTKGG